MNIVKIVDKIVDTTSGLTPEQVTLFNNKYKDCYVHCVNWQMCVPLESYSIGQIVVWSINLPQPGTEEYPADAFSYGTLMDKGLVDVTETNNINSIDKYLAFNKYVPGPEITTEDLRHFRTWLATTLLEAIAASSLTDEVKRMLNYYKMNKVDEVVLGLNAFGAKTTTITDKGTKNTCGCAGGQNLSGLYNETISSCDPIFIYQTQVYNKMVETFSDLSFWALDENQHLKQFKLYIDGILKVGFDLTGPGLASNFTDCGCVAGKDSLQALNEARLRKLSAALQYMIDSQIDGHKEYITSALYDWAYYLYEIMEW